MTMRAPVDRAKAMYDLGPTVMFASKADPSFHYCLYVPPVVGDGAKVDLLVAVHGTSRTSFLEFRDGFAAFGRWNNCAILCPIFPVGVRGDDARSGYKYMIEGDIRYDKVLLAIVEEAAAKYKQDWSQFSIFGFSGGGHFAASLRHPASAQAVGCLDRRAGLGDPARSRRATGGSACAT